MTIERLHVAARANIPDHRHVIRTLGRGSSVNHHQASRQCVSYARNEDVARFRRRHINTHHVRLMALKRLNGDTAFNIPEFRCAIAARGQQLVQKRAGTNIRLIVATC